ncbi:MAG: STAS domain-containing protein [Pseudonocardiaceae bacterium]
MSHERAQRGADSSGVSLVSSSACPDTDGVVVIVPARELDLLTCPAWHRDLIEQLHGRTPRVLVIDLTRVEFFGAAGLGVLVEVREHAERCGVELRLVVCSRPVWRPLQLTGLAGEFEVYGNLAQALAGVLSGREAKQGAVGDGGHLGRAGVGCGERPR